MTRVTKVTVTNGRWFPPTQVDAEAHGGLIMTTPAIPATLITAAQGGDNDAMWAVISAHDSLFGGIIRTVARLATPDQKEDLMQEARAVLLERIRAYDTNADHTLSTFVYRAVRRAVSEAWVLMSTGLNVEPSTFIRVRQALADYEGNQEAAYLAVCARQSGHTMDRGTFMAVVEAMNDTFGLDSTPQDNGRGGGADYTDVLVTLADTIPDPSGDVSDPVERRELAHWLMGKISTRQSYALRSFYGVGMEKAPDDEVAGHLQTSRANVRKLRDRGIESAQRIAISYNVAA